MSYRLDDTIVAVASPPGGAARGILRLSGRDVGVCLATVFSPQGACDLARLVRPTAIPGWLPAGAAASRVPCEVYFWPTSKSFSGEPAAEIHTLGSSPLLEALLTQLTSAGARLAERGEFTLRAFLHGRVDLTQAEAVLGVVDAADRDQFDVALNQLAGGLAVPLRQLREELIDLLAHLEAGFDFADEDLPFITGVELQKQLAAAADAVADLARRMGTRHVAGEMVRVVLCGWPNTGKSSLFNALTNRSGALVSERPATTRDYLTAEIDLDGARCLLVDTAGVEIEPTGVSAAIRRAAQTAAAGQSRRADVEVLCLDSTRPLNAWEGSRLSEPTPQHVLVLTKTDLPGESDVPCPAIRTSSVTGDGLPALRRRLREAVLDGLSPGSDVVAGTAVRCGESLRGAAQNLSAAGEILAAGEGEELVAAELRAALDALGQVVGAVYTDDLLDRIFSRFCIGK